MTRPRRDILDEARNARDQAIQTLKHLDDYTLNHLHNIGRHTAGNDGYPATTFGNGGEKRGGHATAKNDDEDGAVDLTSVEAAAVARIHGHQHDQVGDWLRLLFANLTDIGALATTVNGLAQLITNVKPDGPERLTPACIICDLDALPRPKRGMCGRCYKAWRDAGCPDIAAFEHAYRTAHQEAQTA